MASNKIILVTGANGQVGKEFRALASSYPQYQFLFTSHDELPIEQFDQVQYYFAAHTIHFCINCAAYTAVDKAETEKDAAFLINATAAGNLAAVCHQHKTPFLHISTDYVFDGTAQQPYTEDYTTNPVNVYGQSKLEGEKLVLQNNPSAIIIRTSWVYSSFGNNFVKTMLRLMKERESINVVEDQLGCPTYAADLANAIMHIVGFSSLPSGIFNYCNEGITTWHQFATAIKNLSAAHCIVNPIPTTQYPTPAKRPQYSVLDTAKIKTVFAITIPGWQESLKKCLALIASASV